MKERQVSILQIDVIDEDVTQKKCIACRQLILVDATLCVHCKSDQSPWRNELRYFAGVAGIFTLIASGLAFTTSLGFQIWQRIFGHELAITNVDPFGRTVVWNLTGNPIYLRTINITSEYPKNDLVWEVHQTIPANKEVDVELTKVVQGSWYGLPGELFGRAPLEYAQLDQSTFEAVKQNQLTDKYVPTFLMPNSESYTQLTRVMRNRFQTFECKTNVVFIRLSDGSTGSVNVPCKGAFRLRSGTG
jgi:hypothetical protein